MIIFAEKFPLLSRFTILFGVFELVASFNSLVIEVILFVFPFTFVNNSVTAGAKAVIMFVILAVLVATDVFNEVMEFVLEVILVSNPPIVDELTPPTVFTIGISAVPPKSFVNFNLPFTVELASATDALVTKLATKAVVAI